MIPTYGQEDVILEAVDSALAQDYPNLEIIIADDASPDRTAEVVAARSDPRLCYHRNSTNLGRVANYRNTLYNLAKGDWVVNLDGDDYYTDPGFISAAMQAARDFPDIVIVSARCRLQLNGHFMPSFNQPAQRCLAGIDVVKRVYSQKFQFFHMATVYNRNKALLLDFYRADVISADWESLYRLAVCGNVVFIEAVAGVWRLSGNNASLSTNNWQSGAANLAIWDRIFDFAAQKHNPSVSLSVARQRMQFAMSYQQFSLFMTSKPASADIGRFLLSVGQNAGAVTMLLLLFYARTMGKILLLLLDRVRERI